MSKLRFFLVGGAVLVAITFAAYAGVLKNEFVEFDDNVYVTSNTATALGLSAASVRYAWTTFDSANWIPLTWLTYQLNATLFGIHPAPFHAANLALHGLNVVLLFAWLARVTGSRWRSLVVAALFAVHPLHVESVAWVAELKDVLSTFWLLVTLITYERYAARPAMGWYLATGVAFSMGLLAKSMVVTLPVLLLLVDFWPLKRWSDVADSSSAFGHYSQRTLRYLIVEKLLLFGLALLDGLVTIIAQAYGDGEVAAITSMDRLPLPLRLGNALQSYGWYIAKTIWPTNLAVYYPHPLNNLSGAWVAAAILLLACMTSYVGLKGFQRPHLLFGWLWYLISLLPVIGLLQVGSQARADRYSYLPHIGLLVLIVWEIHYGLSRLRIGRSIAFASSVVAVTLCAWLTASQVAVWRTTQSLWAHALAVDSENWFAHLQIGERLIASGHPDEAIEHLQSVLKYRPNHSHALNNLGWIYQGREKWSVAEQYYRQALAVDARHTNAMHNLVTVLKKLGRAADATNMMKSYLEHRPNDAKILNELGLIEARSGQMPQARDRFAHALTIAPDNLASRNNLALALAQLGHDEEAISHLEKVLSQQPNDANAHVNLGGLLEKTGHLVAAREHYAAALKINPNDQEARERLLSTDERVSSPQ